MIINVKLKVLLGALMIRSLRVFEISLTTCKICGNNSAEKLISEPVLKVLHYSILRGHGKVQMNYLMIRSELENYQ